MLVHLYRCWSPLVCVTCCKILIASARQSLFITCDWGKLVDADTLKSRRAEYFLLCSRSSPPPQSSRSCTTVEFGNVSVHAMCRSFDPQMGTTARVLWVTVPELLHVGAVILIAAIMVGIVGNILFGFRAQAVSSLTCRSHVANTVLSVLLDFLYGNVYVAWKQVMP